PEPERVVHPCRSQYAAVRRKSHHGHRAHVSFQGELQPAGPGVPELHGAIAASRSDQLAVRGIRDTADAVAVPWQNKPHLSRLPVAEFHRLIETAHSDGPAIREKRQGQGWPEGVPNG